jgi:hypothetical protein
MEPSAKKRKGGVRQRMQETLQHVKIKSVLAQYLLREFAWGVFSPQRVQCT